jgi:hypothetical protein
MMRVYWSTVSTLRFAASHRPTSRWSSLALMATLLTGVTIP